MSNLSGALSCHSTGDSSAATGAGGALQSKQSSRDLIAQMWVR
jgi:hypothetical protein